MMEIFSVLFIGVLLGFYLGTKAERNSWVIRANGPTAHFADGTFYWITIEPTHTHTVNTNGN
jgi:hypothetical protein